VDDPEKLYRLRRRETKQAKKLDFVDSKSEDEGSLESPKNPSPQRNRENRLPPMREQPQERKIGELCTPDIVDLPILNLVEIERPFEIKTSTIRMVQHSPLTGKEDPNLHLQAFVQLCQTFNMDGVSYGPPWAHYLGGYQDRLLGGSLGLPDLCRTVPDGMRRKDYGGEVLI
jgi:hypothetical protein